jgi:hypothetical protein
MSVQPRRKGGPDLRGSSADRRRRKSWLLRTFGDGTSVPCNWCGKRLTRSRLEADRYPVAGKDGGTYRRENIVPACRKCNGGRGE